MIKWIKINNLIYQNIESKTTDENDNEIYNIPTDPAQLRKCCEDTLGWLVFKKLEPFIGSIDKRSACLFKAVVLFGKIVSQLNLDMDKFTEKEKNILKIMQTLAEGGYSDSELLDSALNSLMEALTWYREKQKELTQADTTEDMVKFLENL